MHDSRKRLKTLEMRRWTWLAALLCCAGPTAVVPAARAAQAAAARPAAAAPPTYGDLIYDRDYPFIGYSTPPKHNDVAYLIEKMKAGKVKLEFRPPRGYLDSLLKALHIDPDSQTLVFSKTSLQASIISPETPRAIYFNDDTYIAWIDHAPFIEISTMDGLMGTVFYSLNEQTAQPPHFERETTRCLQCHDTFSESGGGVPNFLFLSTYTRERNGIVTNQTAVHTSDDTPITDRWGGWYVSGDLGGIAHLGNILPPANGQLVASSVPVRNYPRLDSLFDTHPYLTDTSDVVALLVLQHQVDVHNLIIHANYKCRMLMERNKPGSSTEPLHWGQLTPTLQQRFKALLDPLIQGMLMVGAAKLPHPVHGTSGFTRSFEARGPRDRQGRSLRDLDLHTRLFKYPLSFLIYSEGFDYLPEAAKEYVYHRLDEILTGRDKSATFDNLSTAERTAIFQILRDTKPAFARSIAHDGVSASVAQETAPAVKG